MRTPNVTEDWRITLVALVAAIVPGVLVECNAQEPAAVAVVEPAAALPAHLPVGAADAVQR
jgi:hypothetical protein